MLYLVGLGLGDAKDITVKGLEVVKKASKVYLESYTSILTVGKNTLEDYYGRELTLADREMVEQNSDEILQNAKIEDVVFLVVGDPLGATTHSDLMLRARELNIPTQVIHNASILTAVGCCGLQLYKFGETVSLVLWTDTWKPVSYYDKILSNRSRGLHTLCLLDIKMKEQSLENLMRGRKVYEPPKFMSASDSASQLLEILDIKRKEGISDSELAYSEDSLCVGLARVGTETQKIHCAPLSEMASYDLGGPLHSLVLPGHLHPLELDMLRMFAPNKDWFEEKVKSYQEQLCM